MSHASACASSSSRPHHAVPWGCTEVSLRRNRSSLITRDARRAAVDNTAGAIRLVCPVGLEIPSGSWPSPAGMHWKMRQCWRTRSGQTRARSAALFALPSLAAVGVTFVVLRWTQRGSLSEPCEWDVPRSPLMMAGKAILAGVVVTAILLLVTSARGGQLGLPIAIAGILTAVTVSALARRSLGGIAHDVSCGFRRCAVRGKTSDSGVSQAWCGGDASGARGRARRSNHFGLTGRPVRQVGRFFCFRIEP
jgi:hypothetical protein